MKHIFVTSAILVTVVISSGCGDQKQPGSVQQSEKPTVSESAPVQEKFENVTKKLSSSPFGAVDGINDITAPKAGSTVSIKGERIVIAGNFVDAVKGEAAAGVVAMIDGKPYVATYGGERPDIAKVLNNPKYLKSQFYLEVPTANVGVGVHELRIRVIAADKSGYYESDLIAKLDVK